MERFNYRRLRDVLDEDTDILLLLEAESYGDRRDMDEEMAEREAQLEREAQQRS